MSRILIIEDEVAIAELEKDYLELSGFEVEIEHRGDVGLKRALTEEYNLVILDVMLPEMDGFDICRELRVQKNIPIIMVSAKKDDIDKIRGLGLGADDYMTKPFSPSELVARVKAHLTRYERLIGTGVQENDVVEIIRYSIVLEILLEMRFCAAVGVPKKSGVARLSGVFATAVLANFQDRLVMTTSITLRRVSLAKCFGIWREFRERTMKFLYDRKCRKPLILQGF